jgi:hypothetical protein
MVGFGRGSLLSESDYQVGESPASIRDCRRCSFAARVLNSPYSRLRSRRSEDVCGHRSLMVGKCSLRSGRLGIVYPRQSCRVRYVRVVWALAPGSGDGVWNGPVSWNHTHVHTALALCLGKVPTLMCAVPARTVPRPEVCSTGQTDDWA